MRVKLSPADAVVATLFLVAVVAVVTAAAATPFVLDGALTVLWPARLVVGGLLGAGVAYSIQTVRSAIASMPQGPDNDGLPGDDGLPGSVPVPSGPRPGLSERGPRQRGPRLAAAAMARLEGGDNAL
jgi:hypothetical protein